MEANINTEDDLEMSELLWTDQNNHKDPAKIPMKGGADSTIINKCGKSTQKLPRVKNSTEMYEELEDGNAADLFEKDQDVASRTLSMFLSQPSMIDSSILKNRLLRSKLKNKKNTIKLLEQHGIKLLPVDDSTLIANALNRGQIAVLTEAGKLALKKTEPDFLYNLGEPNSCNPFVQMSSKIMNQGRSRRINQKFKSINSETSTIKPNIAKIDETESSMKSSADKNVDMSRYSKKPYSKNEAPTLRNRDPTMVTTDNRCTNAIKNYGELEKRMKCLEDQLFHKSETLKRLKNQLEATARLAKNYKTKYEMKGREASLYKIQLQHVLKTLAREKLNGEK